MATAMGESAVGLVRVSGADALALVAPLLRADLAAQPSHTLRRVALVHPRTGEPIDTALCAVMRAPRSYTGEDVVELSCHGSPALLHLVTGLIVAQGARLAAPGEFTRRAFLNGRLDLAQAEAVALLIGARTARAVALAGRALAGGLSGPVRDAYEALLDVLAGLEVTLDFPEDEVGLDTAKAIERVTALRESAERSAAAARQGRVVHDGLTVALVGPPNAGKSSLFNALLGRERAIVSPIAGTTRDVVEGTMALAGVPVRLLDTAGLGEPRDAIEAEGMRRSRAAIDESDLLIVVLDGSSPPAASTLEATHARPRVLVAAKSDLPRHAAWSAVSEALTLSALTGAGLDQLIGRLVAEVSQRAGEDGEEGGIVASLRQVALLDSLAASLRAAETSLAAMPVELALLDLRAALAHAAAILGRDVGDAVLDRIFSTFCLGK